MSDAEPLGWAGRVMVVLGHLSRLLAVQGLWLLGTCLGLVLVGAAPATVAALRCLEDDDAGLWRRFWSSYRAGLVSSQVALLPFGAAVACGVFNLVVVVPQVGGPLGAMLLVVSTIAVVAAAAGGAFAAVYAAAVPGASATTALRFGVLGPWLAPVRAAACVAVVLASLALTTTPAAPIALLFGAAVPLTLLRAFAAGIAARASSPGALIAQPG